MLATAAGRQILRPSAASILQLSSSVAQTNKAASKKSLSIVKSVLRLMDREKGRINSRTRVHQLAQPSVADREDTDQLWAWMLDLFATLTSAKSDLAQKETMLALLQALGALVAVSKPPPRLRSLLTKAFPFQFAAHNARQGQLLELLNLHLCHLLATLG